MHPAFVYIVVQVLEDESRRANSHRRDPDPSVEPASTPIVAIPAGDGRSPRAALAALVASLRRVSRGAAAGS